MFYILMAAIVAVIIFVVGYGLGKASAPKAVATDTSFAEKQNVSLSKTLYHAEMALESIKAGSSNPILEAEIALGKIKSKELLND